MGRIKLEISSLRTTALADIRSKVSLNNVVEEVLSRATASQQEITELQCELLVSTFRGSNTIARMKENIGHISEGSSSYCAGALKLGLKKAFELKKKKRQGLGPAVGGQKKRRGR